MDLSLNSKLLRLSYIIAVLVWSNVALSQGVVPVWKAIQKSNPDIQSAQSRLNSSRGIEDRIPQYLSPRVSVESNLQRTEALTYGQRQYNQSDYNATVGVEQVLLNNPLQFERNLSASETNRAVAQLSFTQYEKLFQFVQIYINAVQQRMKMDVIRKNIVTLRDQRKIVRIRLKSRLTTAKDLERINMLIDQRKLQLIQTQTVLEDAVFQIRSLSRLNSIKIPVLATLDVDQLTKAVRQGDDIQELPSTAIIEADIDTLDATSQQILSIYRPTVSLFAQSSYNNNLDANIPFTEKLKTQTTTFGLKLSWTIMDGAVSRVAEDRIRRDIIDQTLMLSNQNLSNSIERKRLEMNFQKQRKTLDRVNALKKSNDFLTSAAEDEVTSGVSDADLFLQLKAGVAEIEMSSLDSIFGILNSFLALEYQSGRLSEEHLAAMEREWFANKPTEDILNDINL